MFVLFPLISFALLFLIFHRQGNCWRSSILLAAISWGLLVTLITEILSIPKLLTFGGSLVLWTLINVALIATHFRMSGKAQHPVPNLEDQSVAHPGLMAQEYLNSNQAAKFESASQDKPGRIPLFLTLLLGGVLFIIATIGLIAVIAPPSNWDSMTYHIGRVVHWIQNRSVEHYPTTILRQLFSGPWAGFTITQLHILSGGDRLDNLVQWFSMVGSILGVSLIAKQLSADLRGQIFSAIACATIPMGILQASSTQTDYVVSFWVVCFVYCVLLTIQDKMSETHAPKVGASLGLAILAKGTAYVYAFPFFIWLLFSGFKRLGWRLWRPLLTIGAIALTINAGQYLRNFQLFGSVLGPSEGQGNDGFSIQFLISNIIRNLALQASTPVRSINLVIIQVVELLHKVLGVDMSDPRTTSPPGQKFDLQSLITHEDLASDPLHLLLIVSSIACFFIVSRNLRKRQQYFIATYLIAIVVAFVLFCLLIVWSPWRSRVHLPLFVLSSAFVGVVWSKLPKPRLANGMAVTLIFSSFIWVFCNESRPLLLNSQIVETGKIVNIFNHTRGEQYFINRPELQKSYVAAASFVESQKCSKVGLLLSGNTWEYPLWMLLQEKSDAKVHIQHVNVENVSAVKSGAELDQSFAPCALIASESKKLKDEKIVVSKNTYIQKWAEEPVHVFLGSKVSQVGE